MKPQITNYQIVHRLSGEPFKNVFRSFNRVSDAKNSYRQQTNTRHNLYRGEKFDEQTDWVIEKRVYELVEKVIL